MDIAAVSLIVQKVVDCVNNQIYYQYQGVVNHNMTQYNITVANNISSFITGLIAATVAVTLIRTVAKFAHAELASKNSRG